MTINDPNNEAKTKLMNLYNLVEKARFEFLKCNNFKDLFEKYNYYDKQLFNLNQAILNEVRKLKNLPPIEQDYDEFLKENLIE